MSPLVTVATLPLTLYEGFFREHAYGLSNQNFWQWLGDFGIGFAVTLVGGADRAAAALCRHPRGAARSGGCGAPASPSLSHDRAGW